jgi:hypothetical protein
MLGIDRAVDRRREHDAPAFLQSREGIGPSRIVRRATRPGNRDKTPALGKPRQRRADMAQGGVGHAAIDIGERGEWRIHQHDARRHSRVEMIVDLRRVEFCHGDARKEMLQQAGAAFRKFVENEQGAGKLSENGEQAGSCRGLQHQIGRRDRGGDARRETERDRRRELLQRLALFGAARMGG